MNKNLVYGLAGGGVAVLILVLVLIKSNFKNNSGVVTEIKTPEVISEITVEKTDNGFSPETATIKKGTAVKFVNKSTTPMWVASAPHPTHTDYPEFDQKTNGDIFTFSFDKVGSWKYHNHSPFSSGGVIIVTE